MVKSLSFVAIDFETANQSRASVCQVGVILVVDGIMRRTESWYVIPPTGIESFAPFNTRIHGITAETVLENQGLTWQDSLDCIHQFVQDRPLVAHNARFDQGVFNSATRYIGAEDRDYAWYDTLQLSREHFPALSNHKLPTVASHLGISFENHHDAGADARAAAEIVLAVARHQSADFTDLFLERTRTPVARAGSSHEEYERASTAKVGDLPKPRQDADPNHPLYGQHVVLTGGLGWIPRWEAFELLAWHGAQPQKNITKKTTILVVAEAEGISEDYPLTGSSTKERKTLEYRGRGQKIKAITGACLRSWTSTDLSHLHDRNAHTLTDPPGAIEKLQEPSLEEPTSVDDVAATSSVNDATFPSVAPGQVEPQVSAVGSASENNQFPPDRAEPENTTESPSQRRLVPPPEQAGEKQTPRPSSKQTTSAAEAPTRPRRVFLARTGAILSVPLFGIALLLLFATLSVLPAQISKTGGDGAKLIGTLIGMLILLMICGALVSLGAWLLLRRKKQRRR
jgi:DNA polymerase-3 subunit epsilon